MKKLIVLFLLFSSIAFAQDTTKGRVVVCRDSVPIGRVPTSTGGGHYSWQPASGGSSLPDSSTHSGEYLQTKDGVLQWNQVGGDYKLNNNNFMDGSGNNTSDTSQAQFNTSSGIQSLFSLTLGAGNVGNGWRALYSLLDGEDNDAIGATSLSALRSGSCNVAVGSESLEIDTSCYYNTAVGYAAMEVEVNGSHGNTAIGFRAGQSGLPGSQTNVGCVFLGAYSGKLTPLNLSNTLVSGSYTSPITDLYFGSGYRINDAVGTDYTIHGSGAAEFEADQNGGSIILQGGLPTGSGLGGDIIIKGYGTDTSGTQDNPNVQENFRFTSAGKMQFTADHGTAGQVLTTDGTGVTSWQPIVLSSLGGSTTPDSTKLYMDNRIIAWGNIAANGTITKQFGNFTITHTGASGVYTITLPTTPSAASVTVSPQALSLFNVTVSGAVITVNTDLGTIAIPVATDVAFYFIVTGRP